MRKSSHRLPPNMSISSIHLIFFLFLFSPRQVYGRPRGGSGSSASRTCRDSNGNVVPCPINKTAIIVGVVVGVVALIFIITFAIIFMRRRRKMIGIGQRASTVPILPTHNEKAPSTVGSESIRMPQPQVHTAVPPGTFNPPPGPPPGRV